MSITEEADNRSKQANYILQVRKRAELSWKEYEWIAKTSITNSYVCKINANNSVEDIETKIDSKLSTPQ